MKRLKVKSEYREFRKSVFDNMKIKADSHAGISGIIVDIVVNNRVLTMVIFACGKTDIYVSNVKSFFKDRGKYETTRKVTISCIDKIEKLLPKMELTTDFKLCSDARENVFIFTDKGIYNLKITGNKEADKKDIVGFSRFLYKRILIEYLNAESYSCMTRKCSCCLFGNFFGSCIIKKIVN